jgi:hypothetical protein
MDENIESLADSHYCLAESENAEWRKYYSMNLESSGVIAIVETNLTGASVSS